MKLKLTLGLIALCLCVNLFSQSEETTSEAVYPVKGDTEIGVNIASVSAYVTENGFSPVDDSEMLRGFGFGVHYNKYLGKNWSIKGQLNWDPKGASAEGEDIKINYITLPIMASWHFGKKRRWYLQMGTYVGFLTSASFAGVDAKELFNSTDFGTNFGIGVKIPIGGRMFYLESDGQNSFSDPAKDNEGSDITIARNTFSIGMLF